MMIVMWLICILSLVVSIQQPVKRMPTRCIGDPATRHSRFTLFVGFFQLIIITWLYQWHARNGPFGRRPRKANLSKQMKQRLHPRNVAYCQLKADGLQDSTIAYTFKSANTYHPKNYGPHASRIPIRRNQVKKNAGPDAHLCSCYRNHSVNIISRFDNYLMPYATMKKSRKAIGSRAATTCFCKMTTLWKRLGLSPYRIAFNFKNHKWPRDAR